MALTLVATAGAHTANTYISLADAETVLEGCANTTAWTAATTAQKNTALVQATREIDSLNLLGYKYYEYPEGSTSYQPLHFPTTETVYDGSPYIPDVVKTATALQAVFVLRRGDAPQDTAAMIASGVKSHSAGAFSESYVTPSSKSIVCPEARSVMRDWINRSIRIDRM